MSNDLLFGTIKPHGEFRDVVYGPDSAVKWETPWQSNLIVDGFRTVLAALIKNHKVINEIEIGEGEVDWDDGERPDEDLRIGRNSLYKPVRRKAIESLEFIEVIKVSDDDEQVLVTQKPTQQLQIEVTFTVEEENEVLTLREFALFADDTMINHCIHEVHTLKFPDMLHRTIRLSFQEDKKETDHG
jgi:hypothetical protein